MVLLHLVVSLLLSALTAALYRGTVWCVVMVMAGVVLCLVTKVMVGHTWHVVSWFGC